MSLDRHWMFIGTLYLVGSSFALLVLHVWPARDSNLTSINYAVALMKESNVRSWHGFRIGVMGLCGLRNMHPIGFEKSDGVVRVEVQLNDRQVLAKYSCES